MSKTINNTLALTKFNIKVINSLDEFCQLEKIWNCMASSNISYFPYLSFDFNKIWLKHFLGEDTLFILQVTKDEEIIAIAPFIIRKDKFKGINCQRVELIGNAAYCPIRDFLFAKVSEEEREKIYLEVISFLKDNCKEWDLLDLYPIAEEHENINSLKEALSKSGYSYNSYVSFFNCYENCQDNSSDLYFKKLSKNFRASIRKNKNRALERGNLHFKMISELDEIASYIDTYLKIYETSWKEKESFGPAYIVDHIINSAKRGWLRLGLLYLNDVPIAGGFALVHGGVAYFEKTAYDQTYDEIGPGKLWYAEMIKYVIDVDKVNCIDFLIGGFDYKKNWVSQQRERNGFMIFNSNLKGQCFCLLVNRILPLIREYHGLNRLKNYFKRY